MNWTNSFRLLTPTSSALLLGLLFAPFSARADLPKAGLPLGRPDLVETRTVKELRPGLTHIHIERGAWPKEGPPQWALVSVPSVNKAEISALRERLQGAGLAVEEHWLQPPLRDAPYCMLQAGAFRNREEARSALYKLSFRELLRVTHPASFPAWDTGPWSVNIVIVDPDKYHGPVVAARGLGRTRPSELARERKAVVATNAGFFEYSLDDIGGVPSGALIIDGEWHHEAHGGAVVFIDNTSGRPELSITPKPAKGLPPPPEIKRSGGKSIKLDGIDRMPRGDDIVVMRPDVWGTAPLSHGAPKHVFATQIGEGGRLYPIGGGLGMIPEGGLILMASGGGRATLEALLASGESVEVDLRIAGRPKLSAMYGVPALIVDGQLLETDWWIRADVSPADAYSTFRANVRRTGRTVIGSDATGKIYLMAIDTDGLHPPRADGTPGGSIGVNFDELRAVVQFLGLKNAINLDGGGSTSLTIEGALANRAIDVQINQGHSVERAVSSSILVLEE